jgi:hypothetical protein
MRFQTIVSVFLCCSTGLALPPDYKGKPFKDDHHKSGAQVIPGVVEVALYDLGGEGVAYHDTDPENQGSVHNHATVSWPKDSKHGVPTKMCRPGTPEYICFFREKEGVDVSYLRDITDFSGHTNLFQPRKDQQYIGWAENGEWANYTVNIKAAGAYTIKLLYANRPLAVNLSLDNKPAAVCKAPIHTDSMHRWNKAECGEITFPKAGLQLLTVHFIPGINLAQFEFVPKVSK